MNWKRIVGIAMVVFVVLGLVCGGLFGTLFWLGKREVEREWASKLSQTPRAPAEIRGLIDNLYHFRKEVVPSFVPQSGWDDELCAANVVGAVNFILGEERLKVAAAWKFSRANQDRLRLVYDRTQDFKVEGQRVVEKKDRIFWLSRLLATHGRNGRLTSTRLYVIGYHYRQTRSDRLIINAGADINSHLMLVLGRYDGRWWGYHLYHDPKHPGADPFRIDSVSNLWGRWDMTTDFDVVKIWEVKNSEMTSQKGSGRPLFMIQDTPPYRQVNKLLFGGGRWGYWLDTISVYLRGQGEHFPRVVDLSTPVVQVIRSDYQGSSWPGRLLGFYQGVSVRQHVGPSQRGEYGLKHQCVELINRFYAQKLGHRNLARTGHADSYWYAAADKGFKRYPNGSPNQPQPGDILVFDGDGQPAGSSESNPGHVAIVTRVTEQAVCLVQQNAGQWHGCLPLQRRVSGWQVEPIPFNPPMPCLGWVRR
ncbi:CHAP domain-containing protein [Patescibacteria group bacterium]|nr:CHAP domain-containing protein [Patescibacteria group bacterium]